MVSSDHETHLQELAGVGGQPSLEPEQREHSAYSHVLTEYFTSIQFGADSYGFLSALYASRYGWLFREYVNL
mgnify:CR=1 FL=1